MGLIEKAQDAFKGTNHLSPNGRLYCSKITWQELHYEKDKLINDGELNKINEGIWTSFWGTPVRYDEKIPFGEFEFRLLDPDPYYEHSKDHLRRRCFICNKMVGGLREGTEGNYVHCQRIFSPGEQITIGYLVHEWSICFDCWHELIRGR